MLRRSYKKCGGSFGTSWCDVHGRDCTVDDLHSMDGSDNAQLLDVEKDMAGEKVYEPVLRLVTAGVPCIGNSAMNNNAAGDGDACMRPTGMMLAERDFMKEELIVIECTNQWSFGQLSEAVGDTHTVYKIPVCGMKHGDRVGRDRADGFAISDMWRLTKHPDDYLLDTGSRPVMSLTDYSTSDTDEHHLELAEIAQKRVHPVSFEALAWADVLAPGEKERDVDYEEKRLLACKQREISKDTPSVRELHQSGITNRGRQALDVPGVKFPALIKHHCLMHSEKGVALTTLDSARAMGWPISADEILEFGCVVKMKDLLFEKFMTHRELQSWIGDSWQLRSQGFIIAWILAHLEPTDRAYPVRNVIQLRDAHDTDSVDGSDSGDESLWCPPWFGKCIRAIDDDAATIASSTSDAVHSWHDGSISDDGTLSS